MSFWRYYFFAFALLFLIAALAEAYQNQKINRLVCRHMKKIMMWLRRKLRSINWEKLVPVVLGVSLLLVVLLTLWARWGKPVEPDEELDTGIYEALRIAFAVFEGDSADFRAYTASIPFLPCLLAILVPLSAVCTAATLIWNYLPHHVPWFSHVWYIFSELEPNSIRMAKSIHRELEETGDTGVFIFLRTQRGKQDPDVLDELKEINYFFYPKNEQHFLRWFWRRERILRFYFLSENTDANFDRMQDFLSDAGKDELFRPRAYLLPDGQFQHELYLLSETESAQLLITHLRNGLTQVKNTNTFANTELRLLDRFRAVSYDLLREQPLHQFVEQNRLHVLVLGFGRIGREFFRAACSLGIIGNCVTEFTLCDQQIGRKLNHFLALCPELRKSVNFHPRKLDADSDELDRLLHTADYHYIVVALGDDERNIRVASRLKRYYRRNYWDHKAGKNTGKNIPPQICVNIEDSVKHAYTQKLWFSEKSWDHSLHVFGGLDQALTKAVLMPENLWKAARWIHRRVNNIPAGTPLKWSEYERRSSIACAAHAEYHVAFVGEDYERILKNWKENEPGKYDELLDTEHRRWMAYVRSEGMQTASRDQLEAYFGEVKNRHVDVLGGLTPCLVNTREELNDIWNYLEHHDPPNYQGRTPFRRRDEIIVCHANAIRKCAKDGILPGNINTCLEK